MRAETFKPTVILLTLAVLYLLFAAPSHCQTSPPNGMVAYGITSSTPASSWIWNNFTLAIGGGTNFGGSIGANNIWVTYVDGCCIYGWQIYGTVLQQAAYWGWSDPEGP